MPSWSTVLVKCAVNHWYVWMGLKRGLLPTSTILLCAAMPHPSSGIHVSEKVLSVSECLRESPTASSPQMFAHHLGRSSDFLRGREMRQGLKGRSHPEFANCCQRPRGETRGGEKGGKTRLTALTLLHISSYLYDQWGGGVGRAGWNLGAELTATPVLFPPLSHRLVLFCLSPLSPVLRVKVVYVSLPHVLSLSPHALWSSIPPGVFFLLLFSPHGSLHPPWLPPASLPQRVSPNPWKFGTNELTAEPLPRSLVPNYTVLHTRFPLQMA